MFRIIIILIVALGIFLWYPNSGNHTQNKTVHPTVSTEIQKKSDNNNTATNILFSLFPPKQEWPNPVQKIWLLFNIEEAVHERTNIADWVSITDIPVTMQQALLAIEDHNFYNHGAVDMDGILRAALVNITAGEIVQGGSTITQQLTKNLFLSGEQTMNRKLEEALLSLAMEQHYNKDQLLEIYFNTTYFGAGATGIRAAAATYFDKSPIELTLPESAVLAALPYAPSALNPLDNPNDCKKRQNLVLQTMVKRGYIGMSMAEKAVAEPIQLTNGTLF